MLFYNKQARTQFWLENVKMRDLMEHLGVARETALK
jgi:hypothetical protein